MNIQSTNNNSLNFQAYKVANIKASAKNRLVSDFDIFQLERSDRVFLDKLQAKTKYKNLFPKLTDFLQRRWQKVFDYCIACAHDPDNRTYVAMQNGKPCSIMTYTPESPYFLEGICSIPNEPNKKVPFAGSALLYQLFKDAVENNASGISLEAVTNGPYDVISKYESVGFTQEKDVDSRIKMNCRKYKVKEQLKEFQFQMEYTPLKSEHVSLEEYLD